LIEDHLRELAEHGRRNGESVHEYLLGKHNVAVLHGRIVVIPLNDDDLGQIARFLEQHIAWSAEAIELIRQDDRLAATRIAPLCEAFTRDLNRVLRDGRIECGEEGDIVSALSKRVRTLSENGRMAIQEIVRFLAETRARELFWRARDAIEFREEAFETAQALLGGVDDPAKRIAAVAIIDLAWRQMVSAMARAIRERQKRLPLAREKDLGELGQYLFEQRAIDAGQLTALNEANEIRNGALHAAALDLVPSREQVLRMLAGAIQYRARSGLPT